MAKISLVGPINSGSATGGTGSATSSASSNNYVRGVITQVQLRYNGSPPATTDVTVKTASSNSAPSFQILKVSNTSTGGGVYHPANQAVDNTNSAISGVYSNYTVNDRMVVLVEGANNNDSVDAWLTVVTNG